MPLSDKHIALYKAIADNDKPREYKHFHASSLAECPRALYMKRLGVPALSKPSGAKIIRWQAGHALEEAIRPHIEKLYPGVSSNVRLTSEKLDLTGEYDNYSEKEKTLIEIKSVHDYAFIERNGILSLKKQEGMTTNRNGREVKNYVTMNEPYLHHQYQQAGYKLLLEEQGKKVEKIDYVYISLSGRIVTYSTTPSESVTGAVQARLNILGQSWTSKTPPLCICQPTHELWGSTLQWCDYKSDNGCCSLGLVKPSVAA